MRLLDHVDRESLGQAEAEVVALLALVAGQDVEPAEGSDGTDGRWRIARKVAYDRVISTVDPEARHAHKTVHQRRNGFKAHVVVEPVTGLVTATRVTKASGAESADATVGVKLLATDTADGWFGRLTAVGVPCGPVNDLGEAFALAERLGLAPIVEIDDPRRDGPVRTVAHPITFSATPATYRSAPPLLGEN